MAKRPINADEAQACEDYRLAREWVRSIRRALLLSAAEDYRRAAGAMSVSSAKTRQLEDDLRAAEIIRKARKAEYDEIHNRAKSDWWWSQEPVRRASDEKRKAAAERKLKRLKIRLAAEHKARWEHLESGYQTKMFEE